VCNGFKRGEGAEKRITILGGKFKEKEHFGDLGICGRY
jgi:hypothetical protein